MMNYYLLTGKSGFLGKIISEKIDLSNAVLMSLGRGKDNDLNYDLFADEIIIEQGFDLVIHCAGKAHMVPKSESERKAFFDVNVQGTQNLLNALQQSGKLPSSFVYISSVAVYGLEMGENIHEEYQLSACDPYGKSKVEAEELVLKWCEKNNIICTILRLPLLAGPNPPGNLGAMIDGINKGYYFNIGGGSARKSIVLAEDVAKLIPIAAKIGGIYNLTDGYHPSFSELSHYISVQAKKSIPLNIPFFLASLMAKVGDVIGAKSPINTRKLKKITSDLTFDDKRARKLLNWKSSEVLKAFKIK